MSQECIKNVHTSDITFTPKSIYDYLFSKVEFKGLYLKQDSVFFLQKKLLIYIFHTN